MILLGIGLQVALYFSMKHNGFRAPPPSKALSWITPSFLTSFFPTLLIATPLAYLWGVTDWAVRWFQPYILLAQGNAVAEDTLLLDYIAMNKALGIWSAFRKKHWIVLISMLTGLLSNLFQPLAGALISVKSIPTTSEATVHSITTVGLTPNFNDLNAFLAAAGFTEAAAFQGLPDPPFVMSGWAAAQIERPQNFGLNASVKWNTTGVRTQSNCITANSVNISTPSPLFMIDASTPQGCRAVVSFDPASADQQYGSAPAMPTTCGMDNNTAQEFLPVMFWFFHLSDSNRPQARAVICRPTLGVFNAEVTLNLNNLTLANVTLLDQYTVANNVTGGDLNGRAFNGVLLDGLAAGKRFVEARATSISSGIPGAIFRLASQQGLQREFDDETGFFTLTDKIYTQHLSVSAKSVYFVPSDDKIAARQTELVEKLVIDALASIALSVIFIVIGVLGIVLHTLHLRIRRRSGLYLTTEPGSIATSVALTSHSGFGQLLYPYDDRSMMQKKLQGFRFSLDKRTGAIVADEDVTDWEPGYRPASNLRKSLLADYRASGDSYSMTSSTKSWMASAWSSIVDLPSGMETSQGDRSPSPPTPRAPRRSTSSSELPSSLEQQPLNQSFDREPVNEAGHRDRLSMEHPLPSPHV
ncbi:unnamed protein product [Somion occarium]|uniref:Uncharacterized protein n=1 Tax=Somion occarium TaxID=3059160 RepID=A0ABP1D686_9APHY